MADAPSNMTGTDALQAEGHQHEASKEQGTGGTSGSLPPEAKPATEHTGEIRRTLASSLLLHDTRRLPEVQALVTVLTELLAEELRGAHLQEAIIASTASSLFM